MYSIDVKVKYLFLLVT